MGNVFSEDDDKKQKELQAQKEQIQSLFYQISKKNENINRYQWIEFIKNSQQFAMNIYQRIETENKYINFQNFLQVVHFFTKKPQTLFRQFEDYSFLQFFATIFFDFEIYQPNKIMDLNHSEQLLENLFQFYGMKNTKECSKMVLSFYFQDELDTLPLQRIIFAIDHSLPFLNGDLTNFFYQKFLSKLLLFRNPVLNHYSSILNDDILSLFQLSLHDMRSQNSLDLLYNKSVDGTSFSRLCHEIMGYEAATLILIQHEQNGKEYYFGSYKGQPWRDTLEYQEDPSCLIFEIKPEFHIYNQKMQKNEKKSSYLNSKRIEKSDYQTGLGFGGSKGKKFRIWLDEDLENKSYICNDDETYEPGMLAGLDTSKLNIKNLEIWGLGETKAIQKRQLFREQREFDIAKARKVDKVEMLQGLDKGFALGKTFGHENQINGDIEHIKKENL